MRADASEGKDGDPLAAGKKSGAKPKLRDKMRDAYKGMIAEEKKRIDAEPMPEGKCPCGCK